LHVDLMHLRALVAAAFFGAFEAWCFDLTPLRHAAAHLRHGSVVPVGGWRNIRYARATLNVLSQVPSDI
jgi:hypothetical protein